MAPVLIVLGLFPLHPPVYFHLSPLHWPHVTPEYTWKTPGRRGGPRQRPATSHSLLRLPTGESRKGRHHVTDSCSLGLTAGGGQRKVRVGGRCWRAEGSDAQAIIVVTLPISFFLANWVFCRCAVMRFFFFFFRNFYFSSLFTRVFYS